MVMLLFHLGIYGNCCRLNILVITNRHYIVSDWFYQVITIHSDTTQICSKQLIFSGSANNSHPASDYITWPQYQPVSSIYLFLTSPNKRRFILQSKDVLKAALSSNFHCLPTQSRISMTRLFGEFWASRPRRQSCAPPSWLAHWPCCQCCGSPSSCIW